MPVRKKRILFKLAAPEARRVYLCGSFSGWEEREMKCDDRGVWRTRVNLEPGAHEYRFKVDGAWADDPDCEEHVDNTYGSSNCVKRV